MMILLATMLITASANGQTLPTGNEDAEAPVFKSETVHEFLQKNLNYPHKARMRETQGVVIVDFAVDSDGRLSDFSVINSVSPLVDKEVIRAIKETNGQWEPGSVDGKPVKMHKEISVTFKLYPESDFVKFAKRSFDKGTRLLYEKQNPEKALKYLNHAIRYIPYDKSIVWTRAVCKRALGDHQGAEKDRARLETLENRADEESREFYVIK